jgi:hypothetical protein
MKCVKPALPRVVPRRWNHEDVPCARGGDVGEAVRLASILGHHLVAMIAEVGGVLPVTTKRGQSVNAASTPIEGGDFRVSPPPEAVTSAG